jgi:hypothetical protein
MLTNITFASYSDLLSQAAARVSHFHLAFVWRRGWPEAGRLARASVGEPRAAGRRNSFRHSELPPVLLDSVRCDGPINRGGALEALDNPR